MTSPEPDAYPHEYPPDGVALCGKSGNSVVLWFVLALGGVVVVSDAAVALEWLLSGRPGGLRFLSAGGVLAASTLLLAGTAAVTAIGVRQQRYRVGPHGIELPWRARRLDLCVPWQDVRRLVRTYERAPGGAQMGVAIFVEAPHRLMNGRFGTASASAQRHLRRYGTPIHLDLTDVPGGTVRFLAAARHYQYDRVRRAS